MTYDLYLTDEDKTVQCEARIAISQGDVMVVNSKRYRVGIIRHQTVGEGNEGVVVSAVRIPLIRIASNDD